MKKNRIAMGFLAGALMLAVLFLTAGTANAQRIGIGIGVGVAPGYYAPPPVAYAPPYPGYFWTPGYYNPYGVWIGGYWGPRFGFGRPFVGPRGFVGGRAFVGSREFVGARGFAGGHAGFRR